MANDRRTATAEDLMQMPDDGFSYELVRGELRQMSKPGFRHGAVAMRLARVLANHVLDHDLGEVLAAETGFLLSRNPDTVRAPDVAFVVRSRVPEVEPAGFLEGAPALVAEVVSPGDRFAEVQEKVRDWLTGGARLVLVVEPEGRTVAVYRGLNDAELLGDDEVIDFGEVLPGLTLPVQQLFA